MDSDRNRREGMRIIAGVTGATGVIMSYYLLKALKSIEGCEVYLILSDGAKLTWELESSIPLKEMVELADHVYDERDLAAPVSSGSFVTDGMIVLPCSMKTLAGICGKSDRPGCGCLYERGTESCSRSERDAVWKSPYPEHERGI